MRRGCCNWRKSCLASRRRGLEAAFLARLARSALECGRGRRRRAHLQRAGPNDGAWAWSRWPRTTRSAASSPRLRTRRSSSAIGCAGISYDIYTSGRGRLALGRRIDCQCDHGQAAELFICGSALRRPEHYRRREGLRRSGRGGVRGFRRGRPRSRCSSADFPEVIRLHRPLLRPRGLLAHLAVHATSSGALCS